MKLTVVSLVTVFTFLVSVNTALRASVYIKELPIKNIQFERVNGYDIVTLPNGILLGQEGAPELPHLKLNYVIPINKKVVEIKTLAYEETTIDGEYFIHPKQPEYITSYNNKKKFVEPLAKYYGINDYSPRSIFSDILMGFNSGTKICSFLYSPVRYNPVARKIRVITKITLELIFEDCVDEMVTSDKLSERPRSLMLGNIKSMVENPEEVEARTSLSKGTTKKKGGKGLSIATPKTMTVDQVIITNEALANTFQALADWKTKRGLPTTIKTTEWIGENYNGADLQEKIRNFIIDAYTNWGTIWFLLGGDSDILPVRYAWISHFYNSDLELHVPNGEFIPCDMYYACLDRNWNADGDNTYGEANWDRNNDGTFAQCSYGVNIDNIDMNFDVFVGRIPVNDTVELNNYLVKYFNYVKSDLNNKKNTLLYSANSNSVFSSYMDAVFESLPGYFNVVKNYECIGGQTQFCADKQDVLNNINGDNGTDFHLICGAGHGSVSSFEACIGDITKDNMATLHNSNTDQVIYSIHCNTMAFDKECVAEEYLIRPFGGVAYIGNTRFGWVNDAIYLNMPFVDFLYNDDKDIISSAFFSMKEEKTIFNYDCTNRWRFFSHNLCADPEMRIWTSNPKQLGVSVNPAAVLLGNVTLFVTIDSLVSGESALVCIQKGQEVYEVMTISSNGTYTFQLFIDTPGAIDVTVTANNYTPFETAVYANATTAPVVYVHDVFYDDVSEGTIHGNGNGINDAGETVMISLELRNSGLSALSACDASISCNSTDFSFLSDQTSVGSIPSGGRDTVQFLYSIDSLAIGKSIHDLNPIIFSLHLTDDGDTLFTDEFNATLLSAEIEQANKSVLTTTGQDTAIMAGDEVVLDINLINTGTGEAALYATLTRDATKDVYGYIATCDESEHAYPVIGKNETSAAQSQYEFAVSSTYPGNGAPLWFLLSVRNEYGKSWSFSFNLTDRPDVIDLSNLDFTSQADEITVSLINPVEGLKGYIFYRCACDSNGNAIGAFQKLNALPTSMSYFCDKGVEPLSQYQYKVSAVGTTGNESLHSSPFRAWTICPVVSPFPIRMVVTGTFKSSFNAVDVDNDGTKEIFSGISQSFNEGYLLELKDDGTEPYDIDNNVTTYSGFTRLEAAVTATPAIGDINNDGHYQIVSMTRDEDNAPNKTNFYSCHAVSDNDLDGLPDLLWQKELFHQSYRGAVISNIDNSEDGVSEVICYNEQGQIRVFNANGDTLSSFGDNIGSSYGSVCVADLNGDGTKEIVLCLTSGIYIWSHNGTLINVITNSSYAYKSSCVAVDLDNDGVNELVTTASINSSTTFAVLAYNMNGTTVPGWNGSQTITNRWEWHCNDVSAGDIDNDGTIEVVSIGVNAVKIWSSDGTLLNSITFDNPSNGKIVPILADVDGDMDNEIIVAKGAVTGIKGCIHAYKLDGSEALGFPLIPDNGCVGSPCVADIDNDGTNELIFGEWNMLHVYKTNGNPNHVEWGCERHDSRNTGEYLSGKPRTITSSESWSINKDIRCNHYIESGATLTIDAQINTLESAKMVVRNGGTLIIDGGKFLFTDIEVQSGGRLVIRNNGKIKLHRNGSLKIHVGANADYEYGSIVLHDS